MSGNRNEKHTSSGDASAASRGAGLDEAAFRSFCEGAREGILVVDVGTKQPIYANPAFAHMFGYAQDEILKLNVTDLHPTEALPSVERDFELLVKGELDRSEQTCQRKDNSLFPARIHAWPVSLEGRYCAAGFFEDITETRQTKDRMNHLNAVLRSIRNVNQLITQCRDRDALLQGACDCLTETRGYGNAWISLLDEERKAVKSLESGLGERFRPMEERLTEGRLTHCCAKAFLREDVVVVEDPPTACPDCPLAHACGGRTGMTVRLAYDGCIHGVLSVSIPPDLAQNEEERDLLGEVAEDIAFALHGLEVEEERKYGEEALRKAKELSERIIEDGPVAITQVNRDGEIVVANRHAEDVLGLKASKIDGIAYNAPDWRISDVDGSPFPDERLPFQQVMATDQAVYDVRHAITTPDGKRKILSINGAPLHDAQGRIDRVVFAMQDITERKRIENELKESEERFKALHNASFGGIVIHDKGLILECNRGLSEITGYAYDELIGMDGLSLISDGTRDKVVHNITTGYEKPYEAEGVRKNGEIYPVRLEARKIKYKGKDVRVVEFRDITERKQAEQALRASEELHRTTLTSIGDGVVSTDAVGRVKTMNPVAENLTGWQNEDAVGRPLAEVFRIVNANTRETAESPVAKVIASGKIIGLANHTILIARDGTERQIADSAAPIRNANGDTLGVVLVFRDVTEEYAAAERLRKSEELFQTMLALIPDMISVHDPDMNIVYSNWNGFAAVPEERRALGEKCYRAYRGLDAICPDCKAKKVIETRQPYAEEVELPEGLWIDLHVIPILGSDGTCELFVEWVHDVTERKQTEERLRQMEKMDAIGQLAGGVAHDFNNQLGGIMGYADMLSARLEDASLRRYAENILACTNRAADLTAKLLAFARKYRRFAHKTTYRVLTRQKVDASELERWMREA